LHGRKIAIDASMAIYQFLIAVRSGGPGNAAAMLTNADGETTSHVQGLFNRTIRFLTEGIRPVYVFDGKPPSFKSGELTKRKEKRQKAEASLKAAQEDGNIEEQDKHSKRLVRAGHKENEDCIKLLKLMGVPVVKAPCEAEAQASAMAVKGLVYAVGTEDMDALTFKCPVLLRKMTFANASKSDIQTMNYEKAITELDLTHDQFVDLCIMLGCDYCDSIRGVGPKTALKLVREHKCIEEILKNLDRKKYGIPETWIPEEAKAAAKKKIEEEEYNTDDEEKDKDDKEKDDKDGEEKEDEEELLVPVYVEARKLFNHHEVDTDITLKWEACKEEELTTFLVDEMGFNPDRVKNNIEKLKKAHKAGAKPQLRMDNFFKPKPGSGTKKPVVKKEAPKKAKAGGGFRRKR
jgi:flap endonuclease-1